MKPVIGISANYDYESSRHMLSDFYVASVRAAGGRAIILPSGEDNGLADEYLGICQGLMLSGGGDLDPALWGELPSPRLGEITPQRDSVEMALARRALAINLPLLGICRGCQVLAVAAGGSLYQDLAGDLCHMQKAPRNYPIHAIFIEPGTRLERILGQNRIKVNSFHHQAVKQPGKGFLVTARAADGTVEAIESPDHGFALGVQWHPECMDDEASKLIFKSLVAAATEVRANITGI